MRTKEQIFLDIEKLFKDDAELALQIAHEVNIWDGSLDHLDFIPNDEDFFNTYFGDNVNGAVRATCFGDYNYADDYVLFNGYGNLDSYTEYEVYEKVKEWADEIAERVVDVHYQLCFDNETLQNLIDEYEEAEAEEK